MSGQDTSRFLFESLARPLAEAARLDQSDYTDRLLAQLKPDIERVLQDPAWRHGRRVQNMFEAMVVAFDYFRLIKTEDAGTLHPADQYSLPDFRIVLKDGSQILVEVKNVYRQAPFQQRFEMRASDLEKKIRYANAVGIPLKLAVYWARWGIWTLIDPKHLQTKGTKKYIDMMDAARFNETACIGDQTIGTRAPLTIRFVADRTKERRVAEDGKAPFTIAAVEVLCEGEVLTGLDRDLALLMIQFGEWREEESVPVVNGDVLDAVDFNWVPEQMSDQGFDIVGSASRMFARYYSLRTIDGGQVVRTAFTLEPGLFRVLTHSDATGHSLPLWRLIIQPAETHKAA